ncbi:hypothetical protein PF005_g9523 [Phytophthora fragariae]|uniref:Uncharacterized protein n=1 Tax=Phytophthora fragariae TaxID=53985 RepID=A0A6A3TQL0_9STRA|nr:hypothetical protein PF003_g20600 [Phytophthora fragariae]KAE8950206.1 hypothetical protein PF009_g268 [Phytophthora fragariae]KAE9031359.1 hypothetical protein PF011_g131 [Phytophthora fragariae]KAE9118108.1 hypothetical protein PF006_g18675 [Phytophthora fragariae]KAE9140669.1 hypothetical protein PF010_g113 [Phytophthora fragariae]
MEQLNLLQLHGREHHRLYDVFGTPTEFQLFLKD